MVNASFPVLAAWATAGVFGLAGLINLAGLRRIREFYANWDVAPALYVVIGVLQLLAAFLLVTPELRGWGIFLAAPIVFGTVVLLLDHGLYLYAAPVAILLLALGAAIFAIPTHNSDFHYAAALFAAVG